MRSKQQINPEGIYTFPQEISEKVLTKWNYIRTKGSTVPGVYETFDVNNLPEWWDAERIKNAQRVLQKDLYW